MSEQLLNQGGYGCVYFPAKTCHQKIEPNDFVTKVQMKEEKEERMGKLITNIADFGSFFAPVIETCPVIAINPELKDRHGKKCNIIKKANDQKKELVMMRIPYIPNGDFKKYIKESGITEILSCYRHLLLSIEHLININIIHYDLKEDNILFNRRLNNPIIIDFGLSFQRTDVPPSNLKELKKYFYVYEPTYSLWPLDVHLLCLIADDYSNPVTNDKIEDMCKRYVYKAFSDPAQQALAEQVLAEQQAQAEQVLAEQAQAEQVLAQQQAQQQALAQQQAQAQQQALQQALQQAQAVQAQQQQQAQAQQAQALALQAQQAQADPSLIYGQMTPIQKFFYDKSIAYYAGFVNIPLNEVVNSLLKNWKTWDLYAIHLMFYKRSSKRSSERSSERSNKGSNMPVDIFTTYIDELMMNQLDPDPTKRKNVSELMDKIQEIYYL